MASQPQVERYSVIGQAWLAVNGVRHRLAQAAPEFVILVRPTAIPQGPATLIVEFDGVEDRCELQVLGPDESAPGRLQISRRSEPVPPVALAKTSERMASSE